MERRLVAAARDGQLLDLTGGADINDVFGDEEMDGWGVERTVRPDVVRDLLLGRHGEVDPRGVRLRGARLPGVLDLDGVRSPVTLRLIDCDVPVLQVREAQFPHLTVSAVRTTRLDAEGLRVDHDLQLPLLRATGSGRNGVVRLRGADIGGQLVLAGAWLVNSDGPALAAEELRVGGSLFLTPGFRATGTGPNGPAVRLIGAQLGNQLAAAGAELSSTGASALIADGLRVGGGVFLTGGFRAAGAGPEGAVRLIGARIGDQLDCGGAEVSNDGGPALRADRLEVGGDVSLAGGFRATGTGESPAVHLDGVRIGGQLACTDGRATSADGGTALSLYECHVDELLLDPGFADRIDPRGLRYQGTAGGPALADWLRWFGHRGLGYTTQPYQHLAAAYRAAGHEADARRVLIAQQRDLYRRGGLTGWLRLRHRILGATLGYGYKSWRALSGLLATLAVSVALTVGAGAHAVAAHRDGTHCSAVEQVGLGVDLGAPLIATGAADVCAIDTRRVAGQALTVAGWLLQLSGWAFATLFVAGFTGVIRRQ